MMVLIRITLIIVQNASTCKREIELKRPISVHTKIYTLQFFSNNYNIEFGSSSYTAIQRAREAGSLKK